MLAISTLAVVIIVLVLILIVAAAVVVMIRRGRAGHVLISKPKNPTSKPSGKESR